MVTNRKFLLWVCGAITCLHSQPMPAQQPGSGQLDASPALFTVFAALNAAGFDVAIDSPTNHPLRGEIRKLLASRNIPSLGAIKEFVAAHKRRTDSEEFSQYVSFGLSIGNPPDFAWKFRTLDMPPDVSMLQELQPLIVRFHQEAQMDDLWRRVQPAIDQLAEQYHGGVAKAVLEVNSYLRNETSGFLGRRFQVYLDFLGPPNQIQTRGYGDDFYIVLTPSLEPKLRDVRFGYLRYLLDPLAFKYGAELEKKKALLDFTQAAPALPEPYKLDFGLLAVTSLMKAVESRLPPLPGVTPGPVLVNEAFHEGYILAPAFAEQLAAYEKQDQSMRLYFPEMVKGIDLKREEKRLEGVEFVTALRERRAKTASAPPPPQLTGVAKTLDDAENQYASRNLAPAKDGYLAVLKQTDEKVIQAKAYYGLARIAVLEKDPALGERLFTKAIETGPDDYTRGWCLVYLGRLAYAAGDVQQSRLFLQQALDWKGASVAAKKAAEKALQDLQKP